MSALAGSCHCGAVRVSLDASKPTEDLPLRACQCGFCRRHGARTTSDPASFLSIVAAPNAVHRYRMGRKQVDVLICRDCGCYVASLLTHGEGRYATLNVAGTDLPGFEGRVAEPSVYDAETDAEKLARRLARWTPATFVEASPSA